MKRIPLLLTLALLLASATAFAKPQLLSLLVDHGEPLTLDGPASSVFVANPDIADVQVLSPTKVMLFGKRTGETSFMATDNRGTVLAERTVVVSQDLSALHQELKAALPGNNIQAKPVPGGIVLTGTAHDPVSATDAYRIAMRYLPQGGDIINRIQVTGSNQIQIRVRFAEVQRNVDDSFGFNWQNLLSSGDMTLGLATGSTIGTGSSIISTRPSNTKLGMSNNVLGLSTNIGDLTVNGVIDALAQEGYLTILAEPNLTAMSGETANFLAGGEFPIPIPQSNGTISIEFKPYGISLAFTPTVLSDNRISLHVRPEVSELTDTGSIVLSNITVPALTTRKAETTVEVASGESFAIAGLMNNSQTQTVNKFPMLGDLPVLGALFRSNRFVNGQTELIVIITPYIVKPTKSRLALPTDGFIAPTESERLTEQRYSSMNSAARPMSGEPIAVLAPPASAPVAPVAIVPENGAKEQPVLENKEETVPHASNNLVPASSVKAAEKPAASSPEATKAKPVKEAPAPTAPQTPPLVLHTPQDEDHRIGGLLVE